MLVKLLHQVEHALFELKTATPRVAQFALCILRYPYALAHDIWRGDLTLRAMSLVYTTLLSLVPLLALVFSILKGLGYHRELEPALYQFLEPMGEKGAELAAQVMRFVDNARGDVLGSLGVAFLLYTTISMIQKIEDSFNTVWRVAEPRSIARRIGEYLGVLIVGPTLIAAALGLMATLGNYHAVQAMRQIEPFGTLVVWLGNVTPYVLVMGVFTFLYAFVPNTKVQLRAAVIGGVVAGFLWVGSGLLFASFASGAKNTMLIYAGFAIVILALIWLHISWLILLVGAQLAFYVQHPQCLRPGANTGHLTASVSERVALSIMYLVGEDFMVADPRGNRRHYTLNSIAERLFVAAASVAPIIRRLEAAGLILVTDNDRFVPGRDLSAITLTDILDAVRSDQVDHAAKQIRSIPAADAIAAKVTNAIRASLKDATLKELIERQQ